MFSCRLGRLRAGDADEVRQHAPRVGALCVAEADGAGHRVRHAQHLQPRQILGAEAGAHAARAQLAAAGFGRRAGAEPAGRVLPVSDPVVFARAQAPAPGLKTAPNVVQ